MLGCVCKKRIGGWYLSKILTAAFYSQDKDSPLDVAIALKQVYGGSVKRVPGVVQQGFLHRLPPVRPQASSDEND